MYVRMLTGRYKGQEREASPAAARAMLADGRAERVYPAVDGPTEAVEASSPASETVEASVTPDPSPQTSIAAPAPISAPRRRRRR